MSTTLTDRQKKLRKRILEISFKSRYSHLGSCLSAVDAIDVIHQIKKPEEHFILSNGHAGIALYTVLESHGLITPEDTDGFNIHPDRDPQKNIHVSTGSLGQGLPIALGFALANKNQRTFCMLSDGECAEGSVWESIRIASEQNINNLKLVLNANGWGAYDAIDLDALLRRLTSFGVEVTEVDGHNLKHLYNSLQIKTQKPQLIFARTTVEHFPFLKGLDAHYYTMSDADYESALDLLK